LLSASLSTLAAAFKGALVSKFGYLLSTAFFLVPVYGVADDHVVISALSGDEIAWFNA
jgi:hypothetical protein